MYEVYIQAINLTYHLNIEHSVKVCSLWMKTSSLIPPTQPNPTNLEHTWLTKLTKLSEQ